jgi:hypothetical protein
MLRRHADHFFGAASSRYGTDLRPNGADVQHGGGSSAEKGRPRHRAQVENGSLVFQPEHDGWRGRARCEVKGMEI